MILKEIIQNQQKLNGKEHWKTILRNMKKLFLKKKIFINLVIDHL